MQANNWKQKGNAVSERKKTFLDDKPKNWEILYLFWFYIA